MTTSLLDLSDQPGLEVLSNLVAAMRRADPEVRPLLVGALARDVMLSYAHGIQVARATQDLDFAFALDSWEAFSALKDALLASEAFDEDPNVAHRLIFERHYRVDLIPFDGVERDDRTIVWPPEYCMEMQMLGYREAMAHAVNVRLPGSTVDVASVAALAILKLFAWKDRRHSRPGVDAGDLRLLLRHYLEAGNEDRLYTELVNLLDAADYDHHKTSAWLLGCDARWLLCAPSEAPGPAVSAALHLLEPEVDPEGTLALVRDMRSGNPAADLDLLIAFYRGLDGKQTS